MGAIYTIRYAHWQAHVHHTSAGRCRVEEVLGNRDLLQRVFRLVLGGKGDSSSVVPLHFQHAQNWGQLLLVNQFWKVYLLNLL